MLFGRIVRPDFVLRVLHAKQMDRYSVYVCVRVCAFLYIFRSRLSMKMRFIWWNVLY